MDKDIKKLAKEIYEFMHSEPYWKWCVVPSKKWEERNQDTQMRYYVLAEEVIRLTKKEKDES